MTTQRSPALVLVVDDDAMSRDLLAVLLEGEGYVVKSADSGEAALALLGGGRKPPAIVLTDVQMPGVTGSQLADRLRKACGPDTLLLAMSGSGPGKKAIARFDGFLLKPFTMQEMAVTVLARGRTTNSASVAASPRKKASKSRMNGNAEESRNGAGATAAESGSPALDERIYRQLNDAMPEPQLKQMYAMCVKDARDRIAAMRELVAEGDRVRFVREAHSIKGGCGMLGATEIYGMAARLETSGLDAAGLKGESGVNPLDELIVACDRLEGILGSRV
jgi:CheY-like chemotaxis protein